MLFGSLSFTGYTAKAADNHPTEFKHVTPMQFGIADDTYETRVYSTITPVKSMDGVLFEADITYPESGSLSYMYNDTQGKDYTMHFNYVSTGVIRIWNFLTNSIWIDGNEITNDNYIDLEPSIAIEGLSSFANEEFRLAISTKYVDYDEDGEENDIELGLWFDEKLYDGTYFYLKDCTDFCKPYLSVSKISIVSPPPMLPTDYTYVTPMDFGIVYDTYEGIPATTGETLNTISPLASMDKVLFETKIKLGASTRFYYTRTIENEWSGLALSMSSSGMLNFYNALTNEDVYVDGTAYVPVGYNCFQFDPQIALGDTISSFQDVAFSLAFTTEFTAYDADGEVNDLQFGVWFNGDLYHNQYIYIKDCKDVCEQSLFLYRGGEGCITLEAPESVEREETEERYNLSDGPYLVSGTGTILVNGVECENGATLTEAGTYRIVSNNGSFVRNVELYDSGEKSRIFTHQEKVMPIGGFHGPISGTYSNGESYNHVTEETYRFFQEAGINLITYIPKTWTRMSNRQEIIQNLTYAEEYGIGIYVCDGRIRYTDLSAKAISESIATYSQFNSFKGVFIADEPGTESYYPERDVMIDDCATLSKALNQYSNLYGYIGLLPLSLPEGADLDEYLTIYGEYLDEYIAKTSPKMISYDNYVFTYGTKSAYFQNLNIVRQKAIDNDIPFWPDIQIGNWRENPNIPSGTPTEGQFMWNVNTCLAYGAQGIQYYPLVEPYYEDYDYERYGLIDINGNPTKWYDYVKKMNRHIAAIDEVLLEAESQEVLAVGTKAQETTGISISAYGNLESVVLGNEAEGAIIGAFSYRGKDAFYVVNYDMVNPQTISLDFAGNDSYEYRMIQNAVTSYGKGNICDLTIPAGEAVLVVLEDYVASYDGFDCLTPIDFGMSYQEYKGNDVTSGETVGTCKKVASMDGVMMKTNITFGESTEFYYMKSSDTKDGYWTGLTFALDRSGALQFRNALTDENIYVKGVSYIPSGFNVFKFYSNIALGSEIESFRDVAFDFTITSEFVDYDDGGELNDLKLGVYFNGKLYDDAYIYIVNCKSVSMPSMFVYRKGTGSMTLASPALFGMQMQPAITDSVAMNFVATLDPALLQGQTPFMTFTMNGKQLEEVEGRPKEVGGSDYVFAYPDVMLQNLADTVTATLYYGDSTREYQCSMMDYCVQILNVQVLRKDDGSKYSSKQMKALKDLIIDLVQYATEVQKYRGNQNEAQWLTSKLETFIPDFAETYDQSDERLSALKQLSTVSEKLVGSNDASYQWMSVSLVLGNKTKIRAKFTAANLEGLEIVATIDGERQSLDIVETTDEGVYIVDFCGLRAYEHDKEVTFQFYQEGIETGAKLCYSVNTYIRKMYMLAEVKELLLALHNYGRAASVYISLK